MLALRTLTCLATVYLTLGSVVKPPPVLRWDYGEKGPKTWAKAFSPQCAGERQSPINIETKSVMKMENTKPLTISPSWTLKDVNMINTGPLLVINLKQDGAPILEGGGLPDRYKLAKLAFNWGSTDSKGAEHLIDGKSAPLEMKMVFVKEKLGTKKAALADPDGIAIVSVLYDVMTYNAGFESILKNVEKTKFKGESVTIPEIELDKLVPDLTNFYRYKGSIPVPMCNENVIWTIPTKKLYMSGEQLSAFRTLYSSPRGSASMVKMMDNAREPQPLNGRPVYQYVSATSHPK